MSIGGRGGRGAGDLLREGVEAMGLSTQRGSTNGGLLKLRPRKELLFSSLARRRGRAASLMAAMEWDSGDGGQLQRWSHWWLTTLMTIPVLEQLLMVVGEENLAGETWYHWYIPECLFVEPQQRKT